MRVGAVPRLQLEGWLYRDCKHLLHHLDAATVFELLQDNTKGRHLHVVPGSAGGSACTACTALHACERGVHCVRGVHLLSASVLSATGQSYYKKHHSTLHASC
jgi:hypothetical protein